MNRISSAAANAVVDVRGKAEEIPPPTRVKSALRLALEAIPVGGQGFVRDVDALVVQRYTHKMKKRGYQFRTRVAPGGVNVWRVA